jgi:hypothetical protein
MRKGSLPIALGCLRGCVDCRRLSERSNDERMERLPSPTRGWGTLCGDRCRAAHPRLISLTPGSHAPRLDGAGDGLCRPSPPAVTGGIRALQAEGRFFAALGDALWQQLPVPVLT